MRAAEVLERARAPAAARRVDVPAALRGREAGRAGRTTYESAQSVHLASVQDSVARAAAVVMAAAPGARFEVAYARLFAERMGLAPAQAAALARACSAGGGDARHSRHGVTFGALLERVWQIVRAADRDGGGGGEAIARAVRDELFDGEGGGALAVITYQ